MKFLRLAIDAVPIAAVLVLISCATHKPQNEKIQAPTMDYSVPPNCLTKPVMLIKCKDIEHCKTSAVAFDANCGGITTSISK